MTAVLRALARAGLAQAEAQPCGRTDPDRACDSGGGGPEVGAEAGTWLSDLSGLDLCDPKEFVQTAVLFDQASTGIHVATSCGCN